MNGLVVSNTGALVTSDSDRIRIAAAWEALSVNSRRSYQGAWDRCGQWLADEGFSLEDLSDEMMAVYIATLDAEGKTPSTIAMTVAAVKWFFANVRNEERSWQTTENKLRSIRRDSKTRGPGQVAPLTYNLVDRICSQAESGTKNPLAGLRDSAIIRLTSDCLLRVSEVAAVNVGDLKDNTLTIRQSKTDQLGEGRVLFVGDETVQVIEELKAKANISRGALFCRVLKDGKTTVTRLTPEAIREIVKKRSQGIRGVKGRVSGHSLRVGSAVSLARGNASLVEMQVDGRWKDSRMPSHYASAEIAKNSATARIKYGKRR